jgi:hypothetical protein
MTEPVVLDGEAPDVLLAAFDVQRRFLVSRRSFATRSTRCCVGLCGSGCCLVLPGLGEEVGHDVGMVAVR